MMEINTAKAKELLEKARTKSQEILQKFKSKKETDPNQEYQPDTETNALPNIKQSLAKLKSASKKQKTILATIAAVIILLLGYFIYYQFAIKPQKQVVNYVVGLINNKSEITSILGSSIQATETKANDVNTAQLSGSMQLHLQGSQAQGDLSITLSEGQATQLILIMPNGQQVDILQLEKQKLEMDKKKAEEVAKQQAIQQNFEKGLNYLEQQQYQAAIPLFEQSITDSYNVTESYQNLGVAYSALHEYPKCIENFKAYLQLKPNDGQSYYQLAYCYLQNLNVDDALKNLQTSCEQGFTNGCDAYKQIQHQQTLTGQNAGNSTQDTPKTSEDTTSVITSVPNNTQADNLYVDWEEY